MTNSSGNSKRGQREREPLLPPLGQDGEPMVVALTGGGLFSRTHDVCSWFNPTRGISFDLWPGDSSRPVARVGTRTTVLTLKRSRETSPNVGGEIMAVARLRALVCNTLPLHSGSGTLRPSQPGAVLNWDF